MKCRWQCDCLPPAGHCSVTTAASDIPTGFQWKLPYAQWIYGRQGGKEVVAHCNSTGAEAGQVEGYRDGVDRHSASRQRAHASVETMASINSSHSPQLNMYDSQERLRQSEERRRYREVEEKWAKEIKASIGWGGIKSGDGDREVRTKWAWENYDSYSFAGAENEKGSEKKMCISLWSFSHNDVPKATIFCCASSLYSPSLAAQPFWIFPIDRLVGWYCGFFLLSQFPASWILTVLSRCRELQANGIFSLLPLLIDQLPDNSQVAEWIFWQNFEVSDWCPLEKWSLESVQSWMFCWKESQTNWFCPSFK